MKTQENHLIQLVYKQPLLSYYTNYCQMTHKKERKIKVSDNHEQI